LSKAQNKAPIHRRRAPGERNIDMALATQTRTLGLDLGRSFASLRAQLADRLEKRRVYNRTYNELASLSDRDLADLGLTRSAIKGLAYRTAYGA
jgi:uncharacterized protein YjiS (DUF1127 family)